MTKTKTVEFKDAATIPGDVLKQSEDKSVGAGEPIKLPTSYADHVINEGFAVLSDGKKKPTTKAAKSDGGDLLAQLAAVKQQLGEQSDKLLKAETDLSTARTQIGELSATAADFNGAFAAIEADLAEAKAELLRRDIEAVRGVVEAAKSAAKVAKGLPDEDAAKSELSAAQAALKALEG